MVERLWTETLRRFFYQFLLRNLDLASAVMADDKPLSDWQAAQASALARLQHDEMPRPPDALRDVLNDEADARIWTLTEWQIDSTLATVAAGPELNEILTVLERKRLQLQKDYTSRKLQGGNLGLRKRTAVLRSAFYILVFLVLGLNVVVGLLRWLGVHHGGLIATANLLIAIASVMSAAIVALQMWDRGERISAETERMEWYLAGVDGLHRRYLLSANLTDKIRALVDLEELAYQEMRQFLVSVDRSEFVAG